MDINYFVYFTEAILLYHVLNMLLCVCVFHDVHVEVTGQLAGLSFYHVSPGTEWAVRLGSKCLHFLSHLAGPALIF